MKNVQLHAIAALLLSLGSAGSAFAVSDLPSTELARDDRLLTEIEDLARVCVVRPYQKGTNGRIEFLPLRSICREIQVVAPGRAHIFMRGLRQGQYLRAVIRESQYSDGGDLNDMTILSPRGRALARVKSIPAFNDVLLALTGGREIFRKVPDRQ